MSNEILYPFTKTVNGVTYTCYKRYTPTGNKRGRPKLTEQQKLEKLLKKVEEIKHKIEDITNPPTLVI